MEKNEKTNLFGMGFISFIKEHNIKFNLRPFSNPDHIASSQIVDVRTDNLVDLHLEIAKKVDALIEESEKEILPPTEENFFEDYEQTVLNPLKQELMQRYSLWLE